MTKTKHKILVADDEESLRYVYRGLLEREGYDVETAADGEEALLAFERSQPDLVLLDIMMPKLNGYEICERLKGSPQTRLVPVVMVTASSAKANKLRGLEAGADDFLSKPVDSVELTARVRSLLRIKSYTDELEQAESVLMALARSIEGKDPYTRGHCERLSSYGEMLGRRLGRPTEELIALRRAGVIHDIGKVAVPDTILLKPGKLTAEETAIMRKHPGVGDQICSGLRSLRLVRPIIRHHHEKMDGSGYPDGLSGEEIPLTARILTIVDVYDALITDRPYRAALPQEKVLQIMQEEVDRGWWDPQLFAEFRRLLEENPDLSEIDETVRETTASA